MIPCTASLFPTAAMTLNTCCPSCDSSFCNGAPKGHHVMMAEGNATDATADASTKERVCSLSAVEETHNSINTSTSCASAPKAAARKMHPNHNAHSTVGTYKRRRPRLLLSSCLFLTILHSASTMTISFNTKSARSKTASFATVAASKSNPTTSNNNVIRNNGQSDTAERENYSYKPQVNNGTPVPFDAWLDRTTAKLLNTHDPTKPSVPLGHLTIDDVALITTLMSSHARRGTVEGAMTCERLLKRVVEEVNAGNGEVGVTTKMYTVAMDAWAKSQRRPLPGSGAVDGSSKESEEGDETRKQTQLQLHPSQQSSQRGQQIPLGAAAQRAHRIHNSLVSAYKLTKDPLLAPSTVSYNAAINAWSKSYHPSAGEMAELLLGEMMREWRFGIAQSEAVGYDDEDVEMNLGEWADDSEEEDEATITQGNERVRPDVVTFTAVIDAWVKCTAIAHDYHYTRPPPTANFTSSKYRKEKENYAEWKRNQAAEADSLTKRAANRAKQLLDLMIALGHYDESKEGKCEACMRPNCYTYSAVMNALAKSCSALRAVSPGTTVVVGNNHAYDPAREAQDMLETMIEKYERYKERVGEPETWKNYNKMDSTNYADDDRDSETNGDRGFNWDTSWETASYNIDVMELSNRIPNPNAKDPHWFDPRPDELTFPPNTINYNSVLNAWSRASRYDPQSAERAEEILLERMERSVSEGGDAVEPDALSYSLVIHAWLRGCRGFAGANGAAPASGRKDKVLSDQDRIQRAMQIVDKMEAWARRNHLRKWKDDTEDDNEEDESNSEIIDELDSGEDMDDETEDDMDLISEQDSDQPLSDKSKQIDRTSNPPFRVHNKARDLDVEVYNSILVAYSREQYGDHAASVMNVLDRMEAIAEELDMPSVKPNKRSYHVALDVISKSATRLETSLSSYYGDEESKRRDRSVFNPLYAGRAAESILSRMLARDFRPDAFTFASVLNTYQRIPNGRLDAALAADGVIRGMESLHLHGRIDDPPDVFHYTMVCACWSRSGEQGVAGERCSEILRHMHKRDQAGFPRTRPNIRTYNAVIDAHAHNGRLLEAEDMLRSMVDAYESSAARSMDGIEDEELPVRPDSFSFNTVIQRWARSRSPDGGKKAEGVLDLLLRFHNNGNSDVRPDERSFSYIIHHYTKGSGRLTADAPDKALMLLRKMIAMYYQGYKEVLPENANKTNPIFAFTSVIDAHSVLRRLDSGSVGNELLEEMIKLGRQIEPLRPNTYTYLSVLYAWSSCGTVEAGERATELLERMERDMEVAMREGKESIMRTTQRCYILAQTAWARSPSEKKAEGALKVLEMMQKSYAIGNTEAKPTVQAYSMVINACAFADLTNNSQGKAVKSSPEVQLKAFHIAELMLSRLIQNSDGLAPTSMTFGTFIKCCGRLDLPNDLASASATKAFTDCCRAGLVSDFVLTQMRYSLTPERFLNVLVQNGYENLDSKGKSISRDGKRMQRVRWIDLPADWRRNVDQR